MLCETIATTFKEVIKRVQINAETFSIMHLHMGENKTILVSN